MRYRQSAFCGLFSFGKIDCAARKNQTACSHARMVSPRSIGRLPATEMKRSGIEVRKQSIWKRRTGRLECQTETVHAEEKVTKGV